ncbi:origin recognition complex subunit 2 [Battus philenor]|uniref:origin recognition complex subunit 2 n=1 Tax=Battus philenor TaxID=42288 RepID=UPI0035CFC6A6
MSSGRRLRFVTESEDVPANSDTNQENSPTTPKRSARIRSKPKKYGEFLEESPTKRRSRLENDSYEEEDIKRSDFDKPTALLFSDDVEGQEIYKFKSRHTKSDLQNLVKTAVSCSPGSTNSPLKTPKKLNVISQLQSSEKATPKTVRDIIKKRIIHEVESDSTDSDFSDGSSSDFVPDKNDDQSESSSASEIYEDEDESVTENKSHFSKMEKAEINVHRNRSSKPKYSEYIVTPDNYFMMHSSKKITTSDHTLARLKNLNLDNDKDTVNYISEEHKNKMDDLIQSYEELFDRWLFVLSENFNIMLYGIGSKRTVLHKFLTQKLKDLPCVVINGFFPSLTIKSVLETIVIDLLENNRVPASVSDTISLIESQLTENCVELFLIVHNIDGAMLRNAKAQSVLASLSQLKNVHTIATIDHINAPLLWDHSKLSKFNFTWWDVTTFLPYTEETSFENNLMSHRTGALQLSSLKSVYQSLTTNAKGIFNIIIQHQLENQKQAHYQGLPFKDLYSKSREQFLVSSDMALRAQLTEFLDHKLVKIKRSYDGSENLVIPIESVILQQFLEQQ